MRGPKFHACFSLSRSVLALLFSRWGSSRVFFSLSGGLLVFFFSLSGSSRGILVVCLKAGTLKCARLGPRAVV